MTDTFMLVGAVDTGLIGLAVGVFVGVVVALVGILAAAQERLRQAPRHQRLPDAPWPGDQHAVMHPPRPRLPEQTRTRVSLPEKIRLGHGASDSCRMSATCWRSVACTSSIPGRASTTVTRSSARSR